MNPTTASPTIAIQTEGHGKDVTYKAEAIYADGSRFVIARGLSQAGARAEAKTWKRDNGFA